MATIFDMSSGKTESETTGDSCVTDYPVSHEPGLALQQVCNIAEEPAQSDVAWVHIRALLKEF